jgi:hypothetical protein
MPSQPLPPINDSQPANGPGGARRIVVAAVVVEGGLGALALLTGWLVGYRPLADVRWDTSTLGWGLLATVPLLLGLYGSVHSRSGPLRQLLRTAVETVRPLFASCTIAQLALIATMAGLGEELLFRGVGLHLAGRHIGTGAAVVATSVVFGLLHPLSLAYATIAALIGLYLGILTIVFHTLTPAIIVHALYDFVALVYLVRYPPAGFR